MLKMLVCFDIKMTTETPPGFINPGGFFKVRLFVTVHDHVVISSSEYAMLNLFQHLNE